MKKTKTFRFLTIPLIAYIFMPSCGTDRSWNDMPAVARLNTLQQTSFVPTLETPVQNDHNVVYASAFLYAWDTLRKILPRGIMMSDTNSLAFKQVNIAVSHSNSLNPQEYTTEAMIQEDAVIAKAFFKKTLPFRQKYQKLNAPLLFDQINVESFGMHAYNMDIAMYTNVLYYSDDDNFVLELRPEDTGHHIILAKGISNATTLKDAVRQTSELMKLGTKERSASAGEWKYEISDNDTLAIPIIQFNLETNYSGLEGQSFLSGGQRFRLATAYQRTAFMLNERGAVAESEVTVVTDSGSIPTERPRPKKLIFDKPFYVILKRTDKTNPYFVMKVANAELLLKK